MQIKEIARRTGVSSHRVRKILNKFLVKEGSANEFWVQGNSVGDARSRSACFHARIDCDVTATGFTRLLVRIEYSGGMDARWTLVNWLKDKYPFEHWFSLVSASNTVLFSLFLVEYMNQTPELLRTIKSAPDIVSVKQLIAYQHRFYPGLFELFWNQLSLFEMSSSSFLQTKG